jgi:DHA2 family multidrug resistance protein
MGNATGLFNMLRNIGGGIGISMVATMLTRMSQQHTNLLVANISQLSPSALNLIRGLKCVFAGSGPMLADQQAYAAIYGMVQREATMVALIRVFQYLGILVLVLVPLIALTRRPPEGEQREAMIH